MDKTRKIIARLLKGATTIIFTETVWRPNEQGGKDWYFTMASGGKGAEYRIDRISVPADDMENARNAFTSRVMAHVVGKPVVVIDCLSELDAARLCEQTWPCERSRRIRRNLEAELLA
ncbi:hypothetical protein IB262_21195 [Ensifer sp. ENS02]|uniref:hypothetical protein n=1 Tax=Ensifer sp. ENS02 TaxID=2769290 RepID=UPI001783F070|nr:hypothetical protein [Ensifer sp. ENS02]MBD9522415.1 hypothetical protein [Ensifer sp. ENS02]